MDLAEQQRPIDDLLARTRGNDYLIADTKRIFVNAGPAELVNVEPRQMVAHSVVRSDRQFNVRIVPLDPLHLARERDALAAFHARRVVRARGAGDEQPKRQTERHEYSSTHSVLLLAAKSLSQHSEEPEAIDSSYMPGVGSGNRLPRTTMAVIAACVHQHV